MQALGVPRLGRAQRGAARAAGQHPDARRDRGAARHRAALRRAWPATWPAPASGIWWSATTCAPATTTPPGPGAPGARRLAGHRAGRRVRSRGRAGRSRLDDGETTSSRRVVARGRLARGVPRGGDLRGGGARPTPRPRRRRPLVVGGPEDLLDLLDAGLLGDAPAVLAVDAGEPAPRRAAGSLLTDGLRRREATFARVHDGRSATLAADDDGRRGAPPVTTVWADATGGRPPRRSSARASLDASVVARVRRHRGPVRPETPARSPPFDGRPETAWESGPPRRGEDPWVEVELDEPTRGAAASRWSRARPEPMTTPRIRVETEAGPHGRSEPRPASRSTVTAARGCDVAAAGDRATRRRRPPVELAVAEVRAEGLDVDRTLVLPEVPAAWGPPDRVLLSAGPSLRRVRGGGGGRPLRCGPRPTGRGAAGSSTARCGSAPGADYAVAPRCARSRVTRCRADASGPAGQRERLVDGRGRRPRLSGGGDRRRSGHDLARRRGRRRPHPVVTWIGERPVRGVRLLARPAGGGRRGRPGWRSCYPGGRQVGAPRRVRAGPSSSRSVPPGSRSGCSTRSGPTSGLARRRTVEALRGRGQRAAAGRPGAAPAHAVRDPGRHRVRVRAAAAVGETALRHARVTASPRQLFDGEALPARACGPETVDLDATHHAGRRWHPPPRSGRSGDLMSAPRCRRAGSRVTGHRDA